MLFGYEIFHFTTDALLFITFVASICFSICALVRLRRRRDPARRVFSWVKIAWLMFTIAVFTSLVEVIVITLTARFYQTTYFSANNREEYDVDLVARLASGASALAHCFNVFAELLVFLTLVSMIRCLRVAGSNDDKHPRRHKWARYSAYGISFVITILSLAVFSVALYYVVLSEISSSSNGIAWDKYYDSYAISATVMSITCQAFLGVASVSTLVRACILRRKMRAHKSLLKSIRYLIVCCSLWVMRAAFDIYEIIYEALSPDYYFSQSINAGTSFNEILSLVLMTWPVFIILVILYYLGLDTRTGLVSTGRPLLMEDGESQVTSSDSLSREQPIVTPMAERAAAPILAPITQHDSMFACEGLADAPPQYSPPSAQQNVASGTPGSLPMAVPIVRRPDPPSAAQQSAVEMARPSEESLETSLRQVDSATHSLTTHPQTDMISQAARPSHDRSSSENNAEQRNSTPADESMGLQADGRTPGLELSSALPSHEEALGLYHQADGRPPASAAEPSDELPSHEETMGLYHQADGRPPASAAQPSDELPSHEETMGLYHQADGRPPGSSHAVPPENSNMALFQSRAGEAELMHAPPSHDEAMGLYHQADGRMPESEALPSTEKEKEKN